MERPRRRVLLVEGSSDYHLVRNLWVADGRDNAAFEVDVRNGIVNLREAFRGFLLSSEVECLGVVADADESAGKRWQGFYQSLVEKGYRPLPKTPPLWRRAGKAVDDIPPDEVRFKPQHRSKAHAHTWLAWQEEPGVRMGHAVTRRLLDHRSAAALGLLDWLARLFEAPPAEPTEGAGAPPDEPAAAG